MGQQEIWGSYVTPSYSIVEYTIKVFSER
jgi:hypothetical protein